MARTVLLVALVCALAGLPVNAQLCIPNGSLDPCASCEVVYKPVGDSCVTDMDVCTTETCQETMAGVTECQPEFSPTCDNVVCQTSTCTGVNMDGTAMCTYSFDESNTNGCPAAGQTSAGVCQAYQCVADTNVVGGGSCKLANIASDPRCNDDDAPACEGNAQCVGGVCTYSFAGVDNTAGCAAAEGMEAPVCQKYQCVQDTMDNSGSCKLVDIDSDPNCDSDDACAPKSCVDGVCKTDPNDQTTSCEPSFDVDDGVECFCVPDGSGSSSCSLCISPCPDTKGTCDVSNRFCAERTSAPGQATCGSVTCSILCNRACNTVDEEYASSDCNNKGGCSCKGAISQVDEDKMIEFTGPCCQCNVC